MFELAHGPLLVQVARERNLVDLNWVFVQQFTREEEKKKATERPEIERIELAEFHVVSLRQFDEAANCLLRRLGSAKSTVYSRVCVEP
jgi:hypothetical protein